MFGTLKREFSLVTLNQMKPKKSAESATFVKGFLKSLRTRISHLISTENIRVADLITGYGVSESVRHFYNIYGGSIEGKRVIIQGWGNVGSAAAYYVTQAGATVVGIIDRAGGIIDTNGLDFTSDHSAFPR